MFDLYIESGEQTLKEVALKSNIVGEESKGFGGVKKALEIALVVLVVLLVILGLIIGFNRLKGNEDDEEAGEGQTYY